MKLLFIRHGETEVNVKGLTHKTGDTARLSSLGREQALSLVEVCKKNNVEKLYSSPEKRAIETAEIISRGINKPLEEIKNLHERNWGTWEGKPWEEIQGVLKTKTLEERYIYSPPEGESWKQMDERLEEVLKHLTKQPYESIAVVTHGGVLRALMPILKNEPKESSFRYDFKNGEAIIFDYQNSSFKEKNE